MLASLLAATFLVGCGGKSGGSSGDKNTSGATGWKINAKEGGFQYNTNFKEHGKGTGRRDARLEQYAQPTARAVLLYG